MDLPASQKKLLQLLSASRFCSGSFLADELGSNRTSVWKQIQSLAGLGIEIDAVTGRGYRLVRGLELLDETTIRSGLDSAVDQRIKTIYLHDQIDSTNTFLISRSKMSGIRGAICLAESQTQGKGRRGRKWVSPFGQNIYLSMAWKYLEEPGNLSSLSLAVGVAVIRALSTLGVPSLALKWPNDIVWQGKKLGGILIELSGDTQGSRTVVVGLGLNCAMSQKEGAAIEQEWVDLDTIGNHSRPGRNRLAAVLINEMLPVVADFGETGILPFLSEWRSADCLSGKNVVLHMGNRKISGRVKGINDHGLIQLCTADGETRSYASGEVSFHSIPNENVPGSGRAGIFDGDRPLKM
jgi:BirA family transcriptional regulator, biotin operon repressor / biotin---[acetyl-CoA-carboxylase] ligase